MKLKQKAKNATGTLTPDDQLILQAAQQRLEKAMPMRDAIQIKAAEYWLKLGEADQALKQLECLPSKTWNHGWAIRTRVAAIGAWRERSELSVRE